MLNSWIFNGLSSAICFAGIALVLTKIRYFGLSSLVVNFYLFSFTLLWFGVWNVVERSQFRIGFGALKFLIIASLFAVAGNFFDVKALGLAPNPGYAGALKASQIILITLAAPAILDVSLSVPKLIGVIIVLIGIAIICYS